MNEQPPLRVASVALIAMIGASICLACVLVRVAWIQLDPPEQLAEFLDDRTVSRGDRPPRADVVDRRGRVLASSRIGRRIFVDPLGIERPYAETLTRVCEIAGLDPSEVFPRVARRLAYNEAPPEGKGPSRYVSIGRVLDDSTALRVEAAKITGVHLERRFVRESPAGTALAEIVGVVGIDHDGLVGVEASADERLRGEHGRITYVHDSRGKPMWIRPGAHVAPQPADPLRLTIDLHIQGIAQRVCDAGVIEMDAASVRALVVDPRTGEVLAMADARRDPPDAIAWQPDPDSDVATYDPDQRYRVIEPWTEAQRAIPSLRRNRFVSEVYEPGSTFKPFAWAAVLQAGAIDAGTELDTEQGVWQKGRRTITDVHPHDALSWHDVLVYSSNIGMAKGVERISHPALRDAVRAFGFGDSTSLGLPHETPGMVAPIKRWNDFTQTSVSFGYNIAVTPVQMARAFSVFARPGETLGTLPSLKLLADEFTGSSFDVRVRVLAPAVATAARSAMQRVAERMSERAERNHEDLRDFPYTLFGKSGTAELAVPSWWKAGRGYLDKQHRSSFVAAAPIDSPRIVVLVIVDDPGPELVANRRHFGSATAGPLLMRITRETLEYLGVPHDAAREE
ncbi:MAG: penicillin-binding protein 2 [Planctomycetota bacterium]